MSSARNIEKTDSSGKLCCGPSDSTMPSSVAAAWSSKSKERQNRLRSASPQARLIRPAERRVNHQLHPAGVVEETLGEEARLRRYAPSTAAPART